MLDEDRVQQHTIFERLCKIYSIPDEDYFDFIRLNLRSGTLDFYEESTRALGMSYHGIIEVSMRDKIPLLVKRRIAIFWLLSLARRLGEAKETIMLLSRP